MLERELQNNVIELATWLGWLCYHTHDSRRSQPGFPDLVMVKGQRTLFVELKSATGKVTPDQMRWIHALSNAGQSVRLWRPVDWQTGVIRMELGGKPNEPLHQPTA
jgi:hypothetical protein